MEGLNILSGTLMSIIKSINEGNTPIIDINELIIARNLLVEALDDKNKFPLFKTKIEGSHNAIISSGAPHPHLVNFSKGGIIPLPKTKEDLEILTITQLNELSILLDAYKDSNDEIKRIEDLIASELGGRLS